LECRKDFTKNTRHRHLERRKICRKEASNIITLNKVYPMGILEVL